LLIKPRKQTPFFNKLNKEAEKIFPPGQEKKPANGTTMRVCGSKKKLHFFLQKLLQFSQS
jgi:hypothetical protein